MKMALKNKEELISELKKDLTTLDLKINRLTEKRVFFENPFFMATSIVKRYKKEENKTWEEFLCVEQLLSELEETDSIRPSSKDFN